MDEHTEACRGMGVTNSGRRHRRRERRRQTESGRVPGKVGPSSPEGAPGLPATPGGTA